MHVLHIGSRRLAPTFYIFYRLCASLHRLCLVAYRRSGDVENQLPQPRGQDTAWQQRQAGLFHMF